MSLFEYVSLGSVIKDECSGASIRREEFTDEGIAVVPKKAISENLVLDESTFAFTSSEVYLSNKQAKIDKGYCVTTLRNLNPDGSTLGLICENLVECRLMLAQGLYAFRCVDEVDPRYMGYVSRTKEFRDSVQRIKVGSTQVHMRAREYKEIKIPLPPLEEQKRIAAILDKADALRRKRQQAIDLTDKLLRSIFLDMFGESQSDWKTVAFGEVAATGKNTFVNGPFGSNLLTSELKDEGVPVLYIQDVRDGRYNRRSNKHVTELKADELSSCNVFPGDVLVAKVGDPPGAAAVYPESEPNAIVTQDVVRIRPNLERATPEFIAGFLNSSIGERWLAPIIVEATRSRFGLGEIKKMSFNMPPVSLQSEYSVIHKRIESERHTFIQALEASNHLFDSLSQKAFRGELSKQTEAA